ncbi:long-chain-fatty-acid--CoA ligase [Bordetella genomosp. 13]|uniref:long-chain-fatty-acid--CoA ligase n=1 Tax=Bordetella genomosp. 13 TaxID=463040 RepID=UPI0011A11455|nr:long-chain-fatty-acid--CoA ligase [Bordetella genomosp. 13]
MILGDVIERNARCYRDHPAFIFEGRRITHGEFAGRVRRLCHALAGMGLRRGDRIAILAQNCPEYLELYAAAGACGFIAVGVNYRLAQADQAAILRDCEPGLLVHDPEYAERVAALRPDLPARARVLCLGRGPHADGYEDVLAQASDAPPPWRARDDDTLFLIYTSGTTGVPKGVMLGNAAQVEQARMLALTHSAGQDDRMLVVMPMYHIGGTTELLSYLVCGATIVLHRRFDPHEILASIAAHRVTAAHFAPIMIQAMVDVQAATPYDVSSLEMVCYASAPMSVALSRRARATFGPIFMQAYGMTEHGPGTVLLKHQHLPDGSAAEAARMASAGQPILGVDIRIVGEDGAALPDGQVGEIQMRSAALMQGYWRKPRETAEALADGWMKTGDLGHFDDGGYLFIVDRKKDMIISGGENIYSREVEEALLLHPAVREAAVIGVPDEKWGESVKAFVALQPGARADEAALVEHCRALIASYKKPRSIEFMQALPRLPSTNKIDKKALRAPYWQSGRQVA